jgi:hypothetical protein
MDKQSSQSTLRTNICQQLCSAKVQCCSLGFKGSQRGELLPAGMHCIILIIIIIIIIKLPN